MCGIAGACWNDASLSLGANDIQRMTSVLQHRGPDDAGVYLSASQKSASQKEISEQSVALGHRRLSIIDLAGGHQPLSDIDKTVWVAFNGEIYNYRELREQLQSKGHHFATTGDTETIIVLYKEYGEQFVSHLRGMFAIALWDVQQEKLIITRDRLGQKPLFYREEKASSKGKRITFASELKSLLQVPNAPRSMNLQAVDSFFSYQYVPHPESILEGYHKLPPGHIGIYEKGELRTKAYWFPPYETGSTTFDCDDATSSAMQNWSAAQWQKELRERMTEAVRLRMRSDVPLGAFLSGGIDSTIIAGLMQELSDKPILTFSIGFPVKQFDERTFAREAAQKLGTEHYEQVVEPEALKILPKLIWHYDEPFSDSSAIPTMYLSEMTRQHVTVSLSGDAGDELFAGYDRYKAVRLAGWIDNMPRLMRSFFKMNLWQKIPASVNQKSFRRRLKRFLQGLSESPERRYHKWVGIFDAERRDELYSDEFKEQLGGFDSLDLFHDAYKACPDRDFVTRTTCTDLLTYLPCDILTKVDIASMAYSLECRSPFLDHHVVELAAKMPMSLKLKGKQGKQILIDTFSDLLPASIQTRPKMGFGVPLDHWFRNELKPLLYDTVLSERALQRGYFKPKVVQKLVDEHMQKKWDHSYRLWSLLIFEMWQQTYLDNVPPIDCPTL